MFVPFDDLPPRSRVWIYHSDRKFSSDEKKIISQALSAFSSEWGAHGIPLLSSFDIRYDQVIILAVDEDPHAASGCSIDTSVRAMKDLANRLQIDLFNRSIASILTDAGLVTYTLTELKQAAHDGIWDRDTLVVNTLVATKGELETLFVAPAASTWLKRYLPKAVSG